MTGGDGVAVHAVPLDAESLPALGARLELVVGWKRTALWRDGRRLPAGTLTHLRMVLACWRERETSGLGALHCQGWGDGGRSAVPCRLLARALPYDRGSDVPADRGRRTPDPRAGPAGRRHGVPGLRCAAGRRRHACASARLPA